MNNLKEFLLNLSIVCFAVLTPIHSVLKVSLCLIVVDLITGIWRAKKQREPITSYGLRRTVTKICAYFLALLTGMLMEQNLIAEIPIIKLIASLITCVEGKSILENLSIVTGIDFWTTLKERLQPVKRVDKK